MYEIKQSAHGPVTISNGKVIALHEYNDLFDIIDENKSYLYEITFAVLEHIKQLSTEFQRNIKDFYRTDPFRFNVREVIQDYNNLVFVEYPKYRLKYAATMLNNQIDDQSVASLNPEHVNVFYGDIFNKNKPV